jgi:hypothetical protein
VAEELGALLQPHTTVDVEGLASHQGELIGGDAEDKASNVPELADAADEGARARPSS